MARYERFTFLCDRHERRLITKLAERLQRSQADAVRFVVVNAVRELETQDLRKSTKSLEAGNDKS